MSVRVGGSWKSKSVYNTTIAISFESLVQDYKRVFTQCSVSAAWRIFDLLCQASWVRPRIFPRERLVCFRYRVEWVSNPLYAEFSTQTPQPKSPTAASRGMLLHAYLSQLPQIGGRGICSAQPTRCLRQFSRGLSLTLDAAAGFEPCPRFMRPRCYLCTTTAILIISFSLSINIIS